MERRRVGNLRPRLSGPLLGCRQTSIWFSFFSDSRAPSKKFAGSLSGITSASSHDAIEAISAIAYPSPHRRSRNPTTSLRHPACRCRKSTRSLPHGHRGCLSLRFLQFINSRIGLHWRMPKRDACRSLPSCGLAQRPNLGLDFATVRRPPSAPRGSREKACG